MSCTIMYAYLMYEAYAHASDSDIMVVNLDIPDAGWELANGLSRSFLAFNPLAETRTFTVKFNDLISSETYLVTVRYEDGTTGYSFLTGSALMEQGYTLTLQGVRYANITVELKEGSETRTSLETIRSAQYALMASYAGIQGQPQRNSTSTALMLSVRNYNQASELYKSGDYTACIEALNDIIARYYPES